MIEIFSKGSKQNHPRPNVNKSIGMVIDFKRKRTPQRPLFIGGEGWWRRWRTIETWEWS